MDATAKAATLNQHVPYKKLVTTKDLKNFNKQQITGKWHTFWSQQINNHFFQLKPSVLSRPPHSALSPSDEILITRLRLEHTRLTHSFLLENLFPLTCLLCNSDSVLNVHHLLISCPHTSYILKATSLDTFLK